MSSSSLPSTERLSRLMASKHRRRESSGSAPKSDANAAAGVGEWAARVGGQRENRRVSFPSICSLSPTATVTITISSLTPLPASSSSSSAEMPSDTKSIGSETSSTTATASNLSGWLTRKLKALQDDGKVMGILTRTLSRATSRKSKPIRAIATNRQRAPIRCSSESGLFEIFKKIAVQSSYREECRSIIDRYGLIVDNANDEVLMRIVEGAGMLEEDLCLVSPSVWQNLAKSQPPPPQNDNIDFIDAEDESSMCLPDHISRLNSPSSDSSELIATIPSSSCTLQSQLDKIYGKYDLFAKEEYQSWHEKYRHSTLSTKQVKKQDAIYELYLMEKRHCANIAFLLHGYRKRLIEENVVSKQEIDILIPDVLDPLLIFHLNLLEQITERMKLNIEVDTISDIICEELDIDAGRHTKLCCDAYTDFGVAKERSDQLYHHLMSKSSKFAEFFRRTYADEPLYKIYDFKPMLTKIIGRATKYSLLLETILKNEQPFSAQHDMTVKALDTARRFAHKIDENLQIAHMSRRWDEIRVQIEPSSHTNLYVADPLMPHQLIQHHFDIESINAVPNRRLVHIGEAFIKQPNVSNGTHSSGKSDMIPITLVLFDDIIVILYRKGNRLHFVQDQGVLPVKSLLTRPSARGNSIMLISGGKPVLFEISFSSSSERKKWVLFLEEAPKKVPPEGVRLSQTNEEELIKQRSIMQFENENRWLARLEELFKSRISEEETLSNYLETRLQFFDQVRAHMAEMPFKSRHDISDRIREAVRARFRELRRARTMPLNRLIDRMSESRDSDLWSFFDDKADAADILERSSEMSDDSSSSGESAAVGAARSKPRRIQTFHGTSQEGGVADPKNNIRRHTTVPRMNSDAGSTTTDRATIDDDDDDGPSRGRGESQIDRKQYEEMMAKLPLRQSLKARRSSTKLIKEVIALRKENHLLRSDNALTKSRCALLERSRGSPAVGGSLSSTASTVDESMEMLRKKEKEIRELQRRLALENDEMIERRKVLEAQELEIQSKWAALNQRTNETTPNIRSHVTSPSYRSGQTPTFQSTEWSPVLTSLAVKTETKKTKKN
ncbi:unnamed protein product [Caenorhabditis bovis]|uniref:DH domain-containing protein n=1 Tax=Caenorhabditis bovis TaxID=2654633 RepID=A0A8S1F6B4_9PELO|nr:unnamed protein product [Caenorhabditis bovis]